VVNPPEAATNVNPLLKRGFSSIRMDESPRCDARHDALKRLRAAAWAAS
jgi:hypothetical protein